MTVYHADPGPPRAAAIHNSVDAMNKEKYSFDNI
jgi:hypothetical protein